MRVDLTLRNLSNDDIQLFTKIMVEITKREKDAQNKQLEEKE